MRRISKLIVGAVFSATIAGMSLIGGTAQADTVTFIPGTYYLAESNLGTSVDTLVVSISGGVADFTLTGTDNATFTVPNLATPLGLQFGDSPYFAAPPVTASWDLSTYPYLTFWATPNDGGFTAGSVPGDTGSNFINIYQSTDGTGQVFSLLNTTPLPSSWTMMLAGLAGFGFFAVYRRRKNGSAFAAT